MFSLTKQNKKSNNFHNVLAKDLKNLYEIDMKIFRINFLRRVLMDMVLLGVCIFSFLLKI